MRKPRPQKKTRGKKNAESSSAEAGPKPASAAGPPRRRLRIRWIFLALLGLALLPALQTGCVRLIDPPFTAPMLLRAASDRLHGGKAPDRAYRWVPSSRISPDFQRAVLLAEDQRFFQHRGFDWKEIDAARARAKRTGQPVRGASTISMQTARSLFLWQGRSWIRKGLEAYYTFWLELLVPKRRILELYMNSVELGDHLYGVEAAAQRYYQRPASRITREQSAMLAATLGAPRIWHPLKPSPRQQQRQRRILRLWTKAKIPGFDSSRR